MKQNERWFMYQILRLQKLKSMVSITSSMKHAYREQETKNADPLRMEQNQFVKVTNFEDAKKRYSEALESVGKIRKNAVLCIEVVVGASPEWFVDKTIKEQNDYFQKAIKFLKAEFGDNLIAGGIHRDEETPHFWGYIIPKVDGKLNAKKLIGGSAHRLAKLQTDFNERVSKGFGLDRGVSGSGRKHVTTKEYQKLLEKSEIEIKSLKKEISDLKATLEFNRDVIEEKMKTIFGSEVFADREAKSFSAGREQVLVKTPKP